MSQHAAGSAAAAARAATEEPEYQPFAFRRILPIGQLLLCLVLLWPCRSRIAWNTFGLRIPSDAPPSGITVNPDGTFNLSFNPEWERWSKAQDSSLDTVAMLNLPGGIVQLPYAVFGETHMEWRPGDMDFRVWRVVSWPLLCLPFWWMAGRGLEAFLAARRKLIMPRLRWPETVIGFLLMAGGWTLAIGFLFSGEDLNDPLLFKLVMAGSTIWAVLGTLAIAAKMAQWRIGKNQRAALS